MTSYLFLVFGFLIHSHAESDKFYLHGTGSIWKTFTGIPKSFEKSKVEHFELRMVRFDSAELLDTLEKCPNLRTIKLTNIIWDGNFSRKISLPHIVSYTLELPASRSCSLDNISQLQSLLFFYPPQENSSNEWKLDHRFELIDISCSVTKQDVAGFMEKPRHPDPLVRISAGHELIVRNVHFDILEHLAYDDFIKISFTRSFVNVHMLQKYEPSLLDLYIEYAKNMDSELKLQKIIQFAEQMKYLDLKLEIPNLNFNLSYLDIRSLKSLKLFNYNQSIRIIGNVTFLKLRHFEIGSSIYPTTIDCEITATRLKTLNLRNVIFAVNESDFFKPFKALEAFEAAEMRIDISSLPTANVQRIELKTNMGVKQSSVNTKFPKLKSLKLESSIDLDKSVVSSFSKTFKYTRSVIFSGTKTKIAPQLFFQVLNSSATYFIFRFNRNSVNDTKEEKMVKHYMTEFGVPEDYSVNSIILMRESKYAQWSWSYKKKSSLDAILYFVYPISIGMVSTFGILGNVLNGITLCRKQMQSSTTYILICLTLCDFIMLWTSLNLVPYSLSNTFLYRQQLPPDVFPSDLFLKRLEVFLFYPLRKTAYTGSVYTTVLITYERFIAVSFPLHAKRLMSAEKSVVYCIGILAASAVLNLPRWFESYSIREAPQATGHMSSLTLLSSQQYRKYYHGWAWTLFIFVIPVLLIGTFNVTIYYKVSFAARQRMRISSAGRGTNQNSAVDMNLTRMLICLVLVFVILNLTHGGVVLYHTLFEFHIVSFYWDKEKDMSEIEVVACLPVLINSSVNFIIYCAMGKKFREELFKLIPRRWTLCVGYSKPQNRNFTSTTISTDSTRLRSQ